MLPDLAVLRKFTHYDRPHRAAIASRSAWRAFKGSNHPRASESWAFAARAVALPVVVDRYPL